MGTPADDSQATALDVIVDIDATDAALGDEGYHLVGTDEAAISVRASTSAGATNGLHALRRRVLVEGRRGTGSLPSPIDHQVVPGFGRRTVMVAPYPFGGQQGRSVLGADTWGIGRWTEYVEQLRLLNATGLALFPLRMWHPDFPDTFVEKARYEVWRDVMTLCHDVGLEFHWVMLLNQVPDGFLDARPDLAVEQNAAWQGTAAAWWKLGNPNELIALHEPTYEWFRDADAFAYMWNDGGAADYAPQTLSEPVTPLLELIAFARDRIAAAGSGARTVFWGWLMEPWYPFHAAIHLPNFPALATFHADALAALPKDMEWLQESARQYSALGISGYADPLEAAQDAGFDKLTDFYYLSHPEVAEQIFPRPLLADVRAEIEHARARGATGITGYRLSPASRSVNDAALLRLAEEPDLPPDALLQELAALITGGDAATTPHVVQALTDLDAWRPEVGPPVPGHAGLFLATIRLDAVTNATSPRALRELNALVRFTALTEIINGAATSPAERETRFAELLELCRTEPVLRAFSSQPQWSSESNVVLREFVARLVRPPE
ncbi:MAG: hypothetical protein CMJ83_14395 [Planctomycetes bacterium]|nr:hypothetical protein [Planctomycetota bacterium]